MFTADVPFVISSRILSFQTSATPPCTYDNTQLILLLLPTCPILICINRRQALMKPTTCPLSPLNFGGGAASTSGAVASAGAVVAGAAVCSVRICCWRVAMTSDCCAMYCRICSMVGGAGGCCCCCLDMSCDGGASVGDGGGESSSSSSSSSCEEARFSSSAEIVARTRLTTRVKRYWS